MDNAKGRQKFCLLDENTPSNGIPGEGFAEQRTYILQWFSDRFTVEGDREREDPRDTVVPSELWHLQERGPLPRGLPEGAEPGELRLWNVKGSDAW